MKFEEFKNMCKNENIKTMGELEEKLFKKENNKITLTEFFNSEKELAIHCNTEKQAKALLKEFDKMGKKWSDGDSYKDTSYFEIYGDKTAYCNEGCYTDVEWYLSKGAKIYEFEDVIFDKNYPNKIEFTDDEKVILRNLDPKFNWIVRNYGCCETLYVFKNKPHIEEFWGWVGRDFDNMSMFNHLFKCIKNDKPIEFKKYLD